MRLIPFAALARRLPGPDGRRGVHPSTLMRWHLHGLRDGRKLQAVKIAGRWCSSVRWLREFLGLVKPEQEPEPESGPTSPTDARRRNDAVEAEMALRGM